MSNQELRKPRRPKIGVYRPGDDYRYAHLKRDGIWLTLQCRDRVSRAMTRHPTDITAQLSHPTLYAFSDAASRQWVDDATLYCELFAPGKPASYVKSALANGRIEELQIEAFATPDLDDDETLEQVGVYSRGLGVPFAPFQCGAWDDWQSTPDAEGLVYKDGNMLRWAKEKRIASLEAVVTGTKDGNGKYLGLLGALVLSVYDHDGVLVEVARCSGMTDAERIMMGEDEESLIGRVVEVEYQYVGAGGRLRHPRFLRFRDDKNAVECTVEQDQALYDYHKDIT